MAADDPDELTAQIRAQCQAEGFDAVGFADAELAPEAGDRFREFLAQGHHGDMGWLASKADRRVSPRSLWPDARSIVVVGANYGPDHDPLERLDQLHRESRGNISVYARNLDYHDVLKKRLKRIGRWMCAAFDCDVKVFVDTAPVLEKPIGQNAGIGWQGKHTNLVSRDFGSWLFLAEIYTTLALAPDTAGADGCGSCRRCLDVCPTNAFPAPYRLDARRCISYLTIEHKGHIDRAFRTAMGTRIYGCDDCLAVCPWNKFARRTDEPAFHARDGLSAPELSRLARLDDARFRELFRKSPIKRTGRDRFVRNVLIAIGNSGDVQTAERVVVPLLDDGSPLVRAMAVWALGRLLPPDAFALLRRSHASLETDEFILNEWNSPEGRNGPSP